MDKTYIMNPLTRRMIMVGGSAHRKLIKSGVIKPNNEIVEQVEDDVETPQDQEDESKVEKSTLKEEVESEPEIDNDELAEQIAKAAEKVMVKYKNKLEELKEDEESLYSEIQRLINIELSNIDKLK